MSVTAKAEGFDTGCARRRRSLPGAARQALRSLCPQAVAQLARGALSTRAMARSSCTCSNSSARRDQDAIDVGANDGCYVHLPAAATRARVDRLRARCRPAPVRCAASSDAASSIAVRGAVGRAPARSTLRTCRWSTASAVARLLDRLVDAASAAYPGASHRRGADGRRLDSIYAGEAGFIKIDVEGHQQAVLDGAVADHPARCRPRHAGRDRTSACRRADWHAPRPISRTSAIAATSFTHGRLEPIDQFSAAVLQKPCRLARPDGATGRSASGSDATSTISSSCRQASRSETLHRLSDAPVPALDPPIGRPPQVLPRDGDRCGPSRSGRRRRRRRAACRALRLRKIVDQRDHAFGQRAAWLSNRPMLRPSSSGMPGRAIRIDKDGQAVEHVIQPLELEAAQKVRHQREPRRRM